MGILVALYFFEADCQKGAQFFFGGCDFRRDYVMVVILLSFLCNYDNLTLMLPWGKRSYPDEGWLFKDILKVESVPGMSVALEESKKVSKSMISMMQDY